jgi:hypothetical protein
MIHYASLQDAWGNKEIFKKSTPKQSPPQVENLTNSCGISPIVYNTPTPTPTPTPIPTPTPVEQVRTEQFTEHFGSCNMVDHFANCEQCRMRMADMFANTNTISTINIFGCTINITPDVVKVLFIIIIVLIFVLLLSMINLNYKQPSDAMKYLLHPRHINTFYPTI